MSEEAPRGGFDRLEVYRLSEQLADEIWRVVTDWDFFAKDTVGRQMVRAADSIGANIAEGSGRFHFQDNRRFIRMARASLYETRHWLRRSYARNLLPKEAVDRLAPLIEELGPRLNAYLRSIGSSGVREGAKDEDEAEEPVEDESWPPLSMTTSDK